MAHHPDLRRPAIAPLALALLLVLPVAHAQDSGLGVDLHFGDTLDPSGGTALLGCDPDGATWLSSVRKRNPTGFLYACVPDGPQPHGEGDWKMAGSVGFGWLHVTGDHDNMHWQRFSYIDDGGFHLAGNLQLVNPGDGRYVDVRLSHLGSDSQTLRVVAGRAGQYRLQGFVRSQANVTSGNARSIWNGVGSNHLTLKAPLVPAGSTPAQVAAVSAAQPEQALVVVRDKQGVGMSYLLNPQWTLFGNLSHETRNGARPFGGPFFFNFPFPSNGGIYEIPRPIDDSTVNVNGGARFAGNVWRMEFTYSGSFFRHENAGFDYEVPYALRPVVPGLTTPALTQGSFAYEPDNDYHAFSANLTRRLAWNGDLSVTASASRMRQNDELLPPIGCTGQFGISVIPGAMQNCADWNTTDALSRKRADLAINSQLADATLVLQPSRAVTLRGNLKFQRNDYAGTYFAYNPLTGQWGYPAENGSQGSVVPGESGIWDPILAPGNFTRIRNLPLDNETRSASFGADWRLGPSNTLSASYAFDRMERTHREVAQSDDHTLKLGWTNRSLDWLTLRANYVYLRRTGSEYEFDPYEFTFSGSLPGYVPPPGGNAAHTVAQLRKYDVGERTQHKADLMATVILPRNMSLYASLRGNRNDYDAELGRRDYDTFSGSLRWAWQPPGNRMAVNAWYGHDRATLDTANVNDGGTLPDPNLGGPTYPLANRWWMNDRQRNHSAGANWVYRAGRFTFNADWNWLYSRGTTRYRYASPGALANPAQAPLLNGRFPDMVHRTNALTLGMHVAINDRLGLRLFDTYQRGNSFDWHYLGFENGQVYDHRVYTDGGPEAYSVNMIGAMLEVKL